jgi:hypothetical protein
MLRPSEPLWGQLHPGHAPGKPLTRPLMSWCLHAPYNISPDNWSVIHLRPTHIDQVMNRARFILHAIERTVFCRKLTHILPSWGTEPFILAYLGLGSRCPLIPGEGPYIFQYIEDPCSSRTGWIRTIMPFALIIAWRISWKLIKYVCVPSSALSTVTCGTYQAVVSAADPSHHITGSLYIMYG